MHIQHKYPLTSTPPFCHSIYINTRIGLEVEPGKSQYYLYDLGKVAPDYLRGTCQNVVYHISGQYTQLKIPFQIGVSSSGK